MKFNTHIAVTLFTSAVVFLGMLDSNSADAQSISTRVYKVQVQYWFYDTDNVSWSTNLETENEISLISFTKS